MELPQRVSAVDVAYQVVRDRILRSEYDPGTRLSQPALADELGISRTPVREALSRLAAERLLDFEAARGYTVANPDLASAVAAVDARLLFEPSASALAAQHRTGVDLDLLRGAVDAEKTATQLMQVHAASRAFHVALCGASGNAWLARLLEVTWVEPVGLRLFAQHHDLAAQTKVDVRDHTAILEAVRERDRRAAERLARDHLRRTRADLARSAEDHER